MYLITWIKIFDEFAIEKSRNVRQIITMDEVHIQVRNFLQKYFNNYSDTVYFSE